jgi:uncharacterized membrane protein
MFETLTVNLAASQPWFDNAGLVGGMVGAGIGCLAGLYGTLMGVLASRGKARSFMFLLHWLLLLIGIALLGVAIYALVDGQPYGVWYGFGLPGAILTFLVLMFTPLLRRVYHAAEHRRLEAEEFRRGGTDG